MPQNSSKRGIINLLEVVGAAFTRCFLESSTANLGVHPIKMTDLETARERMDAASLNKAYLQTAEYEMDAASKYYDTLRTLCVQVQVSFEDRGKEEIESLRRIVCWIITQNEPWKQGRRKLTSDVKSISSRCRPSMSYDLMFFCSPSCSVFVLRVSHLARAMLARAIVSSVFLVNWLFFCGQFLVFFW